MKKMNLNLGQIGKMLLPVFILIGLFLFSTNTVHAQTAQTLGGYTTKVLEHIQELPNIDGLTSPLTKSMKEEMNNPKKLNDYQVELEKEFGNLVVYGITRKGFENKEAIEKTYEILSVKIPAEYLDPVKQVYIDLLAN